MALLFFEGFEVDGGNSTALGRKYDLASSASGTGTGRLHGTACALANGRLRTRSLTSPTGTVVVGFGYQDSNTGSSAGGFEVVILNGVNEQLKLVTVSVTTSTFRIDLYRGATLLASSASYSTLNWHYFEFKAVIATGTGGSYELRHNETTDFSDTGVNTANSGSASWDAIDLNNTAGTTGIRIDDIYVLDGTGSVNNDFLGDSVVEGRLPTGDGATLDWTPSTGSAHWSLLDDTDDATRVTTDTPGDIDYLTFDSLSFITGTIHGVMTITTVGLDQLGSRTMRNKVLSAAATANGATQAVETTTFSSIFDVFETDPNTSSAWSISAVNAASFGFELVS